MTDREKRLVIHSLSLAHGLLMAHDCPAQCREALLQYQCMLVEAWGQNVESLMDGAEGHELMAAVNDAISQLDPNT